MKPPTGRKIPVLVILLMPTLLPVLLQTTPAQAPAPQSAPTTTFRVTTRLVTVDVVAQNKNGKPIRGLTKDDFELLDNGQSQTISVFSVEGSEAGPTPGVASLVPLPIGTYTNRPSRPPGSATVILLDGLNSSPADLALVRGGVAKFLQQLQPQDRVALYSMGDRLRVVQDFTSDSAALVKALGTMQPEKSAPAGPKLSHLTKPEPTDVPIGYLNTPQIIGMTLRGFEAIGEHLADVPGRKTLIWVSNGFTLRVESPVPARIDTSGKPRQNPAPNETIFTPQVQAACRVLGKYHVALYPLDARGLLMGMPATGPISWKPATNKMQDAHDSGYLLAELTGGRVLYNQNDVPAAIRGAMDDSNLVYVLGYYPEEKKWDAKAHTLKVHVNQPGVKLLYRSSYLPAPQEQTSSPTDPESALGRALMSPLDSTAIGLRAQLQKPAGQPLTIELRIDANDLPLAHDHDLWHGQLEVVIGQRISTGELLADSARQHSVKLSLKDDYFQRLKTAGLELFFPVTPDPKAAQLRVVVRDAGSGAMGSVSIPLSEASAP